MAIVAGGITRNMEAILADLMRTPSKEDKRKGHHGNVGVGGKLSTACARGQHRNCYTLTCPCRCGHGVTGARV